MYTLFFGYDVICIFMGDDVAFLSNYHDIKAVHVNEWTFTFY